MRTALAAVTIGVLCGQMSGPARALPVGWAGGVGGLLLVWAALARRPLLLPLGLGVGGLAVGAFQMQQVLDPVLPAGHVALLPLPLRTVVVGRIAAPPERRPGRTVVVLEVETVERNGRATLAGGRVRLTLRRPARRWRYGDRLVALATLRRPRNFATPGAFDWEAHLARRGVFVTGAVWNGADVRRLRGRERGLRTRVEGWRRRVAVRIARAAPPREAAVLRALVVGDESGIRPALRDAFTRAGVVHVLSVSGLHVALVAGAAFAGLRGLLSVSERLLLTIDVRRTAAALGLGPVALYAALAGFGVPTLRSVLMAAAAVVALLAGRHADLGRALTLAALVLALVRPGAPLEIGFQLSFASVLAIVCGARWLVGVPDREAGWRARGWACLRDALVVSAAASAGTAPLTAFHFHQVAPMGVIANPLVLPLFGAVVVLPGVAGALLEPVVPAVATLSFRLAALALRPGLALVEVLAAPRWAAVDVPIPNLVELALCYGLLAALLPLRRSLRRALAVVALAGLALDAAWWLHERVVRPTLRVTFLDVGQGDATVVELPRGGVAVVDAGGFPGSDFDTGAAIVAPFLWSRKIVRLAALAMTHAHPDHSGGLAYLLAHHAPGEFWWSGVPGSGRSWDLLQQAIATSGARVRVLADDGERPSALAGRAAVLHPARPEGSLNDSSLTLRFTLGDVAVLLTGDIEARAEGRLLDAPGRLAAQVLKVPHHGSRTSSTPRFVEAVAPAVAVVPVGAGNRYGHPAPEVERRYRARGTCVLRTDLCGAVTVVTDGRRLEVSTVRPGCDCPRLRPPA